MEEKERRSGQRRAGIEGRDALTADERRQRSGHIVERILASDWWRESRTVLSYRAVRGEVDLSGLETAAREQGKRLCYPLCLSPGEMIALWPGGDAWKKGKFGIWEPVRERSVEVRPEELDLLLCPCTAFDDGGGRMGMGGGYYDRYLPRCTRAVKIGIALEVQRVPRAAVDEHDQRLDAFVTERGIYTWK